MRCKYWDCGWCYAPPSVKTNADQGMCLAPSKCEEFKRQDIIASKSISDGDDE